jgi:quinol-cytochrome oxidoreductase complex cytochrome b subunit
MATDLSPDTPDATRLRSTNVRTGLTVLAIAVLFFVGVIAAQVFGDAMIGMSVVGVAVLVFLVFAIGRNLRR